MSKGKAHKKYEYGSKASLVVTQNRGIIVGAMTFEVNRYDGHTLQEVLAQHQQLTGRRAKTATVDRDYKGAQRLLGTQINRPKPASGKDTAYQRKKKRRHFRRRAAIEAVIGHLKSDHRVGRNYLKGALGDSMNFIMAAAGFNFKKQMKRLNPLIGIIPSVNLSHRYLNTDQEESLFEGRLNKGGDGAHVNTRVWPPAYP